MWVCYRKTEKYGEWLYVTPEDFKTVEQDALHVAPLKINIAPVKGADLSDAKYYGDFVIDIDRKPNPKLLPDEGLELALSEAITSAQQVVNYLITKVHKVGRIDIYASGVKGFHIVIPAKLLFGTTTPIKGLPGIYRQMAQIIIEETKAKGVDESLYAAKRGHTVRVANKLRPSGTYKVQISYEELQIMTPQMYQHICKEPREIKSLEQPVECFDLIQLYNRAKERYIKKEREAPLKEFIPADALEEFGNGKHPECILKLLMGQTKETANTNEKAHQLAGYTVLVPMESSERESLIKQWAETTTSTSKTVTEKIAHLKHEVLPSITNEWKWSCGAMKKVVDTTLEGSGSICNGCSVAAKTKKEIQIKTKVTEDEHGYALQIDNEGTTKLITNFTLDIIEYYSGGGVTSADNTSWEEGKVDIIIEGKVVTTEDIKRSTFSSAKMFYEAFDSVFQCWIDPSLTDQQVRQLQHYIKARMIGKPMTKLAEKAGLSYIDYVDSTGEVKKQLWWVENSYSLGADNTVNGVRLRSPVPFICDHYRRPISGTISPKMSLAISKLLHVNTPEVVGRILGWVIAATVKEHIIDKVRGFPLLHITGTLGTGKTSLATLFTVLGSANYWKQDPPTLQLSDGRGVKDMVRSTTSIPRLLDEFDESKVDHNVWKRGVGFVKAAYNNSTITIGGLSNGNTNTITAGGVAGGTTYYYSASAPMVLVGTTRPDEGEVCDRTLAVFLKPSSLTEERSELFKWFSNHDSNMDCLYDLAKMLMKFSLKEDSNVVMQLYNEQLAKLSKRISNRMLVGMSMALLGLIYFKRFCITYSADEKVIEEIEEVYEAVLNEIDSKIEEVAKDKVRTECENFLEMAFQTVGILKPDGLQIWRPRYHYIRSGDYLYLDMAIVFPEYRDNSMANRKRMEFKHPRDIMFHLPEQPYYEGVEPRRNHQNIMVNYCKFHIPKLEERGLDCSRFLNEGDK